MHIDLFTFFVQIINFLVLLFILNRVLIKPLMTSVENRRKNIIKQNEDIALKQDELNNEIRLYESKISDFENFKVQEKRKIESELQEQKNLKIIEIQNEVKEKRKILLNKLVSERDLIINDIVESVCLNLSDLLKKIFIDLADEDLESKIVKKFVFRLKNAEQSELDRIKNLDKDEKITISSNFGLSIDNKEAIINFLKEQGIDNNVIFLQENNIILGVKMMVGNIVINSNIQDIIEQFNSELKNKL